jgi:hypothetical protein
MKTGTEHASYIERTSYRVKAQSVSPFRRYNSKYSHTRPIKGQAACSAFSPSKHKNSLLPHGPFVISGTQWAYRVVSQECDYIRAYSLDSEINSIMFTLPCYKRHMSIRDAGHLWSQHLCNIVIVIVNFSAVS